MAVRIVTNAIIEAIQKDLKAKKLSQQVIAKKHGVSQGTVTNINLGYSGLKVAPVAAETVVPELHERVRAHLQKNKQATIEQLADHLDCGPRKVREAVEAMKARGAMLMQQVDGSLSFTPSFAAAPGNIEISGDTSGEWTHIFGLTSDNHLCNRSSRLDVLNAAYDHFEREGITRVFNTGNWIDGEARFNKTELIVAPGMDNQIDYMIDKWPVRKGITTELIAGDDHEGWYQQREGMEIGRYLQIRSEEQGRHDIKYLGYAEADVALKIGEKSAIMRLVHPGGGSAYAISYKSQKLVESYQGGEKPQVLLMGHYHKFDYGYPREVHTVQAGCTTDQSLFMRKKQLAAHVGFCTIKIKQNEMGILTRFSVEWSPFFDRGFYEKRFR